MVASETIHILQCYGVHGSGKTQTILQLADKFPFLENENQNQLFIKWHIQCSDSEHDIEKELENLAEELKRKGFISEDRFYSIQRDLGSSMAGPLVQVLIDCRAHILVVVEDPKDTKDLLNDLCEQLLKHVASESELKFHLYLTCRTDDQVFTEYNRRAIQSKAITGFNEEEAVAFLNEATKSANSGNKAACEIFKRFSGLPLGLQAARGYCTQSRINYDKYLKLVTHSETALEKNEKKMIEKEYGKGAEHVFQAIVMPFLPKDEANAETDLHWNILSCFAYLHHDGVPIALLERCCYMFSDVSSKQMDEVIEANTGELVTKLLNHGMCIELSENEVSFHQVILNAFRVRHQAEKQRFFMKKAIEVMCSLVSKDLRRKSSSVTMSKYVPHLQALLNYIQAHQSTFKIDPEFLLYKALFSHLIEVAATIMSGVSYKLNEECDAYFKKALNLMWEKSDEFISLDAEMDEFVPRSTNVEELAEKIAAQSQEKGKDLPENFVISYASKLYYCFDKSELEKVSKEQFKSIKATFDKHAHKDELVKCLQEKGLFLQNQEYRLVFYAERLATILHSWSRAVLYADPKRIEADKKSEWLSSLSRQVSIQCKSKFKVHLLSEWITMTSGLIPIWLKLRGPGPYLDKVLNLCTEALSRPDAMHLYENGLKKEEILSSEHIFSKLSLLRSLVRVNARLENLNQIDCSEKDQKSEELSALAWEKREAFANSSTCIVHCAKYFAARKNFAKAMDCFQKYFHMIENQQPKFVLKSWAIYNYGRLVASNCDSNNEDEANAMKLCEEVLNTNDVMSEELNRRIKENLDKLKAV